MSNRRNHKMFSRAIRVKPEWADWLIQLKRMARFMQRGGSASNRFAPRVIVKSSKA